MSTGGDNSGARDDREADREAERERIKNIEETVVAQGKQMAELFDLVKAQILMQSQPPAIVPGVPEPTTSRVEAIAEPVTTPAPSPTPIFTEDLSLRLAKLRKEFMKYDAPRFTGGTDVDAAEAWIMNMEKRHESLQLDEKTKVILSTFLLEGQADKWWKSKNRDKKEMEWPHFKQLFYKKYFPKAVMDRKHEEFVNLGQGEMSVLEYESQFIQLSEFASEMVEDEQKKITRFIMGLRPEIKQVVATTKPKAYEDVVERAFEFESAAQSDVHIISIQSAPSA